MTVEVTSECQRRGAWALLGQVTGAQLCTTEREILNYNDIFDAEGNLLSDDLLELDARTGLFIPKNGACNMMLADNFTVVPIPAEFFVHPKTAKVMPIEGTFLQCISNKESQDRETDIHYSPTAVSHDFSPRFFSFPSECLVVQASFFSLTSCRICK